MGEMKTIDPRPQPPEPVDPMDCCGGGCSPCVYDLHDEALEHYQEQLKAWRERNPGAAGEGA